MKKLALVLLILTSNIYSETINGYILPPEPDPKINNSTLLGIDSNNNGVRDDVERWIYKTYKDKHPIHIDIAMQGARAKQKIILNPIEAKHEHNSTVAASYCEGYYATCINKDKEYAIHKRINGGTLKTIIFNTQERKQQNRKYHKLISGHSYSLPWCNESKAYCDFNTSKYE